MTEVKIPSPGESITEVELANWLVNDGDHVEKDQEIAEIESDKATLPLVAEASGKIEFLVEEGASLNVGETACKIDETVKPPQKTGSEKNQAEKEPPEKETTPTRDERKDKVKVSPVAQKIMEDYNLSLDDVLKGLRRVTKQDVEVAREALQEDSSDFQDVAARKQPARETERKKMTRLRKKLSGRLVSVKNETAMLTTFNEADMSQVMEIREKYQQQFLDKHGIKLGLMSFFIKAVTKALEAYPNVNSMIDGGEIVYPKFADIGIAVQTPKGLMVPVIRNAESLSLAEIEKQVKDFAEKGKSNRISIEEMEGGTFSITNGGVFGSLLSTPILNPPQSAILGMHTIQERPVAVEGKVEIRPMMYLALSYDHRLIDGKESVGFLVKVKEMIENPRAMLFDGQDPVKLLLDL